MQIKKGISCVFLGIVYRDNTYITFLLVIFCIRGMTVPFSALLKGVSNIMHTQMAFSQQNFKVHGGKFFDGLLNTIKLENERKELPSSALATYILLHFECNDIGMIPREFQIMDLAKKAGFPTQQFIQVFRFVWSVSL